MLIEIYIVGGGPGEWVYAAYETRWDRYHDVGCGASVFPMGYCYVGY